MNKKEQLIGNIMEKINIEFPYSITELNKIYRILQDTLPEDNDGDVVEKANICGICGQEKGFNKTCDGCQKRIA